MAVTLTYDPTLARVRISVTGLLATVDYVLFERSLDQVSWVTVRGGTAVPAVSTSADLDDYEFTDGVPNYYRATGYDSSPTTFVAAGAAASDANAAGTSTLAPALPAGMAVNDVMFVLASIRNRGVGTVNIPAGGYAMVFNGGNVALLGKRIPDPGTEPAPTVSFTGGVANATVLARTFALRNVEVAAAARTPVLENPSGQDINFPALTVESDGGTVIAIGWKQDDYTSVDALSGFVEGFEHSSTLGDDASQVMDYQIQTDAGDIAASFFNVIGGGAAVSSGGLLVTAHADRAASQETANITPALISAGCTDRSIWVKSIFHPFLNRPVRAQLAMQFSLGREARVGIFPVVGRQLPVAVTDVRGGRVWTMYVETETVTEADEFELILATGDPLLLHVPAGCEIPGGFVVVGDVTRAWKLTRPHVCRFTLPCTQIATPDASVFGAIGTWQTVINTYATWSAVIAAHADWADLLTLQGSIDDLVVP